MKFAKDWYLTPNINYISGKPFSRGTVDKNHLHKEKKACFIHILMNAEK